MFTVFGLARVRGEAAASLAFVFLFQCCYSAAPVYLSHVAASNPDRSQMLRAVLLFIVLYFLPYPLAYAAALWRVLWMSSARRAFYEQAYARTFGRVDRAMDRDIEKSFAAIVSANGQGLVADCLYFVNGSATLLMSSGLSVTLISLFVLGGFAYAYLVSVALCGLLLWRFGRWQVRMAAAMEKAYNRFVAALPEAWHANALGEVLVVSLFMRIFARRWRLHRRVALRSMNAFQSFDMLQAICIWLPAAAVIFLRLREMDVADIIALAIVLPRLTETLLDISNLMAHFTDYLALKGRVTWLNSALAVDHAELASRCDFTALKLMRKEDGQWHRLAIASVGEAEAAVATPGRYLLSGGNGAGKTSLLLLLKLRAAGRAFYLPAQAPLYPSAKRSASTGQARRRDLLRSFALFHGKVETFLLDEWDSSLDAENRDSLSRKLDDLARSHAVVEVSHRGGAAHGSLTS